MKREKEILRAYQEQKTRLGNQEHTFMRGAKWADEHPRWISVEFPHWISVEDDGNPIDSGWYIFTTGKIVDVGYYLGGNEWRDVHPTHWMPLPQVPKKGD